MEAKETRIFGQNITGGSFIERVLQTFRGVPLSTDQCIPVRKLPKAGEEPPGRVDRTVLGAHIGPRVAQIFINRIDGTCVTGDHAVGFSEEHCFCSGIRLVLD